ncbi:MAG TPA: SRPBCC domain-containing protein, partial [Kofleriaceae bacterium]
ITTPTDTTIVLTRSFNAPRRFVFEAMSTPDKMRRWMQPPPGMTLERCDVEPRLGGLLSLSWKTADANPFMTLQGEWTEFDPHSRMVHTERMATASGQVVVSLVEAHQFTEQDGATLMVITQTYESKDARDGALAGGMDEGMESCYQTLDAMFVR